jgi:6-phosphogluconolactonase
MRVLSTFFAFLLILLISVIDLSYISSPFQKKRESIQNSTSKTFLYVNNNDFENTVSVFSVASDGRLQLVSGSPFLTGGLGAKTSDISSMAICRKTRSLFVTNNADSTVTGFRMNPDGRLLKFPNSPVSTEGRFPAGVVVNKQGTRLFVANVSSDSISSFTVDSSGNIKPISTSPFFAGNGPLSLALDKTGTVLFASLQFMRSVGTYRIDSNGQVFQTGIFATQGFTEHGLAYDRVSSRMYVADLGSNTVSGFKVDPTTGRLSLLPNGPYFTDGDRPIDVAIDPGGRFVFVSNNNSTSITVFSVNSDGSLRAVSGSPFTTDGQGPSGMVINDAGTLLFVANGGFAGSSDISVFRIDSSGRISAVPGSPFPTGSIGIPSALKLFEFP